METARRKYIRKLPQRSFQIEQDIDKRLASIAKHKFAGNYTTAVNHYLRIGLEALSIKHVMRALRKLEKRLTRHERDKTAEDAVAILEMLIFELEKPTERDVPAVLKTAKKFLEGIVKRNEWQTKERKDLSA